MKKVFFDTNFLLRFYLDDIPAQALKAKRMVLAAKEGSILLVTDLIVICEMVWVLDSFYDLEKDVISEKITNLYRTPGVVILNGDVLPDAFLMPPKSTALDFKAIIINSQIDTIDHDIRITRALVALIDFLRIAIQVSTIIL